MVETPSAQLVDGYLTEISKAYGVKWTSSTTQAVAKEEAGKLVGNTSCVILVLTAPCRTRPKLRRKRQRPYQVTRKRDPGLLNYLTFHRQRRRKRRPLKNQTVLSRPLRRIPRTSLSLWHVVSRN